MDEAWVGVIGLVVGLLLCFRGYALLRLLLAVVGGIVGFALAVALAERAGAGVGGPVWWLAGLVGALLIGSLAYAVYRMGVVVGLAALGYSLAVSVLTALSVRPGWLVVLLGLAAGLVLAVLAVAGNLPALVLVVVTALAGASAAVGYARLLLGDVETIDAAATTGGGLWAVGALVLAALGLVAQLRSLRGDRRGVAQQWASPRR